MVDLSYLPEELTGTQQIDLTLYRVSQYYKPEVDIGVLLLTGCKKQKTADATEVTSVKHEKRLPPKCLQWKNSWWPHQFTTTAPSCSIWTSEGQGKVKEDKQQIHSWSRKKGTHPLRHDLNEQGRHWYQSLSKWNGFIEEVKRNKIVRKIKQVTYLLCVA